jgi:hypothetical protein
MRNKNQAGRNKNQIWRNKIQAPFLPLIEPFQWITRPMAAAASLPKRKADGRPTEQAI